MVVESPRWRRQEDGPVDDPQVGRRQVARPAQHGAPVWCALARFPCIGIPIADPDHPAGTAAGLPPLAQFIYDFTAQVYRPATSDFKTVINAGSTDAWGKIVTSLCNPGDGVLAEEWTYPCVPLQIGFASA